MRLWILFLLAGLAWAQDEDEEDQPVEITIDGDGSGDGTVDIKVDPFAEEIIDAEEPNRPEAVKVGTWQEPDLKPDKKAELDALLQRRGERPDDVGLRYRLGEFYLENGWWPHAEAEFLACAQLDADSIRPWENLLRVYRASRVKDEGRDGFIRRIRAQGGIVFVEEGNRPQQDWLKSEGDTERNKRMSHAFAEILKRRPDDIARRREFVAHLKEAREYRELRVQAEAILGRLPDDAGTRFELAEATRQVGLLEDREEEGKGAASHAEAFRLLEENLKRVPGHAPSLLRLARMIAVRDGHAADKRITELEQRGFFALYIQDEIAPVPYRTDTFRMARDLVGPSVANDLWDDLFMPDWYRNRPFLWNENNTIHYRRWVVTYFPHAQPRDRLAAIEKLGRRVDREAAGILLAFLWHMEGPDAYAEDDAENRDITMRVEVAGCEAVARMGSVAYPGAENFLRRADDDRRRRRAVRMMMGLKDPRAVRPLIDVLANDIEEASSLGVAAALEALREPGAIDALVEAALDVRRPLPRRLEAAEALAAFEDPRPVEALRRLAKEQGFGLIAAYGLLQLTGAEDALPVLRRGLEGEEDAREVLRLLEKCEDPRTETLLLEALEKGAAAARPAVIKMLRARFWKTAKPKVRGILLDEASSPSVSDETLVMLKEFPGKDTADKLLQLCQVLEEKRWALAARALAETGDDRAVRYFARMKVLEKRSGRRRLARELYDLAAYRQTQNEKKAAPGG